MCRVIGLFARPMPLEELLCEEGANPFTVRSRRQVMEILRARRERFSQVATDCTKKSTKAGYDAAGLGVGVLELGPLLAELPDKPRTLTKEEWESWLRESLGPRLQGMSLRMLVAKDGGDYLETHARLERLLGLQEDHYMMAWTAHIRQASQGDLYSAANAHPHLDHRAQASPLFSTMHNGDILDSDRWKEFLRRRGFEFYSNADSCVIPALQRVLYDALGSGELRSLLEEIAKFFDLSRVAEIADLSAVLTKGGALPATIATCMLGRLLEISNRENKFVIETLSPVGEGIAGHLGGGHLHILRGGFREGGEEGGEAMFYLPYPEDRENSKLFTALVSSEENSLKDEIPLLDLKKLEGNHEIQEAKPVVEELLGLQRQFPEMKAKTTLTSGGAPIFDVQPGEILEVRADGRVGLFDLYSGNPISLNRLRKDWRNPSPHKGAGKRMERIARLKRFQVLYEDAQGNKVSSPFNTYGEEIIVVQPKALRDNTTKLFRQGENGQMEVNAGRNGLGLWMGTDDGADRANTIRQIDFKLVGAAGTSFLMAQIAENICRKLNLNRIPTAVVEGFTTSDSIPPNISKNTLFVANSNSGGTSDTIKLTRELTSLSRLGERLLRRYEVAPQNEQTEVMCRKLREVLAVLETGGEEKDLDEEILAHIRYLSPHVFVVTNTEASPLGDMGRGVDPRIFRPAGVGVTNLPEEECVGSTFAAMASLQWLIALDTYLGEVRGNISREYARQVYTSLAKLPDVCDALVHNTRLAGDIQEFCSRCVGGNNDFIYTDYVDGVAEEQAHKFAEMIQTMAVGWHYFMFQHGKYAHVRRASRHALGSIVGHNVPPPTWSLCNARGLKAPREIKARASVMFAIAHESNREALLHIPDYGVDYVFCYPEDDIALYPFQAVIISHLISYYWGLELKKVSDQIASWNEGFIKILERVQKEGKGQLTDGLWTQLREVATCVLNEMTAAFTSSHRFDNTETRRMNAIFRDLYLLTQGAYPKRSVAIETLLGSPKVDLELKGALGASRELRREEVLTILKDLALELCTAAQAKRIADLFLTDANGRVLDRFIRVPQINGTFREMQEYDYWCQYEGLGEFFHVNPIHPPKIAKAKKGWL